MPDSFKITVLEDGTIKTETDRVSIPNHANAEAFMREMSRLAGGEVIRTRKSQTHAQQTQSNQQTEGQP